VSSSLRRGVLAAAVIAFPITALAACGAGHNAATDEVRPDNAWAEVEDIKVQNVIVIMPDDGDGIAGITARLFNNGADDQTLEAIRLPGTGETVELAPAEGESGVVIPAGGELALGGEGNASALIQDAAAGGVALGNAQHLVFDLSETGGITLYARVVGDSDDFDHYAEWGPTPTAEPTPTDTSDADATDEATGEATDGATDEEATDGATDEATDGSTDGTTDGATGEATDEATE
jgi:hypothetical protein